MLRLIVLLILLSTPSFAGNYHAIVLTGISEAQSNAIMEAIGNVAPTNGEVRRIFWNRSTNELRIDIGGRRALTTDVTEILSAISVAAPLATLSTSESIAQQDAKVTVSSDGLGAAAVEAISP